MIYCLIDTSEIRGLSDTVTVPYDYLVYAVGAETQTFGIKGVREHSCFMKELSDAESMQRRFLDCEPRKAIFLYYFLIEINTGVETAAFPGQSQEEIDRLLHVVSLTVFRL